MFTGLIETIGKIVEWRTLGAGMRLAIESNLQQIEIGESIAVSGVCLTVLPGSSDHYLLFDVSSETLACSNLLDCRLGDFVNLERALVAGARLGGHYVSGHVDTTKVIVSLQSEGDFLAVEIAEFSKTERQFVLPKGSITVNGVSLTINAVKGDIIQLMLIPHTLAVTTLSALRPGERVNIEYDYFTRIIAQQLGYFYESGIMRDFVKRQEVLL